MVRECVALIRPLAANRQITLELDGQNAPGTVRNFLNYVNSGLYEQTLFHYVDAGSMILGGESLYTLEVRPAS